ncbi:MAG: succinate dehydrogenase [Candidatus Omnitrophota bacterium]|jgi:predicted deacylase|nr:MAG: succinate dehydrogenase [Candidatus Omnitrophota bacterium]
MNRRKPLIIAGEQIRLGEIRDLQLTFSESYLGSRVAIPLRVIRGKRAGPRVFITGAIHGDELTGIGIIRELLFDQPPRLLKGTLICAPVVNIFGLERSSRYLPDRRDLNRSFPGSATGSMTSRLAHAIFTEIVRQCDYGIDFHSAAVRRINNPNVRADMTRPEVKKLARAFGCEVIVNSKGPEGSLRRTAVRHGIPTIILEAGEVWKFEPGMVAIGVRGCLNVLKSLGMIEGPVDEPLFQVAVKKTTWVRAERGGFLAFHAKPGDLVRKGQALATNYSIFGFERNLLLSPAQGMILGMTTMPAVQPGEPVYHIAVLADATYRRILKKIKEGSNEHLFQRILEDLSTNMIIQKKK